LPAATHDSSFGAEFLDASRWSVNLTAGPLKRHSGFTLAEVLVALAIVAVALAAASRSVAMSTTSAADTKQRVLAGFVASEGSQHQAGIDFRWTVEIVATPNPDLRRVNIRVVGAAEPRQELRRLVGVLAREG
jgi:general secretion pathway protein I